MSGPGSAAETQKPRVLIVEPDGDLALATLRACLDVGLEPKLCLGPEYAGNSCPGLRGEPCHRTMDVEATLISITTGAERRVAPSCAGGRTVLAGERPLAGPATEGVVAPEAHLHYPYRPESAAALLFQVVIDARRQKAWDEIRDA